MAVGKSSLVRANKGVNVQKTIDKKVVLDNAICDVDVNDFIYGDVKADAKLLKSVETYGLICPVVAVKSGDKLEVVDGSKRISALKVLGVKTAKTVIATGNATELKKQLTETSAVKKAKDVKTESQLPLKMVVENDRPAKVERIMRDIPVWML